MQKLGAQGELTYDDTLDFFRMRDEAHDFLISIQYHDGRADVMVGGVELFRDLVSLHLRVGLYDGSIPPRMIGGRAVGWIVAGAHAAGDDVAIGDRSHVAAVL